MTRKNTREKLSTLKTNPKQNKILLQIVVRPRRSLVRLLCLLSRAARSSLLNIRATVKKKSSKFQCAPKTKTKEKRTGKKGSLMSHTFLPLRGFLAFSAAFLGLVEEDFFFSFTWNISAIFFLIQCYVQYTKNTNTRKYTQIQKQCSLSFFGAQKKINLCSVFLFVRFALPSPHQSLHCDDVRDCV